MDKKRRLCDPIKKEKLTVFQKLNQYFLMIWDGFYFFGFNDTNLRNRLNGAKLKYMDKFKNKSYMFSTIILLIIVGYVLASELSKIGTAKV